MYLTDDYFQCAFRRLRKYEADKALADAAFKLISKCEYLASEMNAIDYPHIEKEYHKRSKCADEQTVSDLERAELCEMENSLNSYLLMNRDKNKALFTIAALDSFILGEVQNVVLEKLKNEPFIHKHQVLTRYHWISWQKKLIDEGKTFNSPYTCNVGPALHRKSIDREFYVLLEFLPEINEKCRTDTT